MEYNRIIKGDCVEVMKRIEDKSIDLTLTDFPYGNETDYGKYYKDNKDNLILLIKKAMPEILRISKRVMITCGVDNISYFPKPDWILAWISSAGAGSSRWGFCCWQPILVYGKDPYLQNKMGRRPDIFESNERSKKYNHPCPKPIKLWKKILLRGSVKKTDLVLDPFLGSGTTAVACKETGRKYIGIEISPEYIEISQKRINQISEPLF